MRTALDFKTNITEWILFFKKKKKLSGEEEELKFLLNDMLDYIEITDREREEWRDQFIDLRAQLRELKELVK